LSNQDTLFDPGEPHNALNPWQRSSYPAGLYGGGPPEEPEDRAGTSHAAAVSVRETSNTMRDRVRRLIGESLSGLTDDEVEFMLNLRHQTASARRRELVLLGLVKDSGERRFTRSGRKAAVWVLA
jgi:hypothetical protein